MNSIPLILHCPECGARHVDAGEWATRSHHTHSCQTCGLTWRPAVVPTVGVQFLPGFKDGAPVPATELGPYFQKSCKICLDGIDTTPSGGCAECGFAWIPKLQERFLSERAALAQADITIVGLRQEATEYERLLRRAFDALIWCSGSNDFQVGGVAYVGWERGPAPLLRELLEWRKTHPETPP